MNQETTKMLQALANKLGTTTEYLWRVLLKQAPIEGTLILLSYIPLIIAGIVLYNLNNKYSKEVKDTTSSYDRFTSEYEDSDSKVFIMSICAIIWAICILVLLINTPSAITGIINPEYWALDKILSKV